MKRIWFIVWAAWLTASATGAARAADTILEFGRFGKVTVYRNTPHPAHVVLFVSGDGGWNLGVVDMARELAQANALVVGIDIVAYLRNLEASKDGCSYPAADFEALSQFVQKKLGFPTYEYPVLVGYSSGATLVYAILVQAPAHTFRGAISLGFCADLPLTKALCRGSGLAWEPGPKGKGFSFLPAKHLQVPWIALQGEIDQVCDPRATRAFAEQVANGRIVMLPKVGHGFSVPKNWMPQFKAAFAQVIHQTQEIGDSGSDELKDLPLVEVPATGDTAYLAVLLTGDGGWAGLDRDVSAAIAKHGIPVVGVNSLKYFWTARTPETAARDLERILTYYLRAWSKEKSVLIGYSFGADVLPFLASRLPANLLERVELIVLLGPDSEADFEFHVTDWIAGGSRKALPVTPEVEKLKAKRVLCLYGEEETGSLCPKLDDGRVERIALKGAHHFGGDYEAIADTVLRELNLRP
jgi:type IV secretory pathway VirJ component